MTIEANPENTTLASSANDLQPFLRQAGDGTYEIVIPLADCSLPLILPYSFSSEDDGLLWLQSRKGSARIERARTFLG